MWSVGSLLSPADTPGSDLRSVSSPLETAAQVTRTFLGSLGPCCPPCPVCRQPCSIFWIWAGNPAISPSLWTFSYHISS